MEHQRDQQQRFVFHRHPLLVVATAVESPISVQEPCDVNKLHRGNNRAGVEHPFPVGDGGGIINFGTLKIIGSTIDNNQCYGAGGGISNSEFGTVTIINSTVNGNLAYGQHDGVGWGLGGGISNIGDADDHQQHSQ